MSRYDYVKYQLSRVNPYWNICPTQDALCNKRLEHPKQIVLIDCLFSYIFWGEGIERLYALLFFLEKLDSDPSCFMPWTEEDAVRALEAGTQCLTHIKRETFNALDENIRHAFLEGARPWYQHLQKEIARLYTPELARRRWEELKRLGRKEEKSLHWVGMYTEEPYNYIDERQAPALLEHIVERLDDPQNEHGVQVLLELLAYRHNSVALRVAQMFIRWHDQRAVPIIHNILKERAYGCCTLLPSALLQLDPSEEHIQFVLTHLSTFSQKAQIRLLKDLKHYPHELSCRLVEILLSSKLQAVRIHAAQRAPRYCTSQTLSTLGVRLQEQSQVRSSTLKEYAQLASEELESVASAISSILQEYADESDMWAWLREFLDESNIQWEGILQLLEHWSESTQEDAIAYTECHIATWPARQRMDPQVGILHMLEEARQTERLIRGISIDMDRLDTLFQDVENNASLCPSWKEISNERLRYIEALSFQEEYRYKTTASLHTLLTELPWTRITDLHIRSKTMSPQEWMDLLDHPVLQKLQHIRVSEQKIDDHWTHKLFLDKKLQIHTFIAHQCYDLSHKTAHSIASSLSVDTLQELDLSRSRLGPEGTKILASVGHWNRLRKLNLEKTRMGNKSTELWSQSKHLRGIQELNVRNNNIRAETLLQLIQSPHLQSIQKLYIGHNRISELECLALHNEYPFVEW